MAAAVGGVLVDPVGVEDPSAFLAADQPGEQVVGTRGDR